VNLKGDARPEYLVVRSHDVAGKVEKYEPPGGSVWYSFSKTKPLPDNEGWELFGHPHAGVDSADDAEPTAAAGNSLSGSV
jgi:hypothetical protein